MREPCPVEAGRHRLHRRPVFGQRRHLVQGRYRGGFGAGAGQPGPGRHHGVAAGAAAAAARMPERGRRRHGDRPAGAGRQDRPGQRLERAGRDQDQWPAGGLAGDRPQQQRVEPLRGVGEQGAGRRVAGFARVVVGEPVQREPRPVEQLADLCRLAEAPEPHPVADHRDGVQRAVELDELDQRGIAESGRQHAPGNRARGLGDLFPGPAAVVVADAPFQRHLAPLERRGAAVGPADPDDLVDRGAQFRQQRGKIRIGGRLDGPEREVAGPALLRPLHHLGGPAVLERHPQAEPGHLNPVPGGVGAQVRGSQAGLVLVHDAQRGARRGRRAAAVPRGPPLQCLGVPGLGALQGGPRATAAAGLLKLGASPAGPALPEAELAGQQPGLGGGDPPARRGQVVGGALQLPDPDPAGPAVARQLRPQDGEAGQRRPAKAPLVAELPCRLPGFGQAAAGLTIQDRRLGQQQPCLGQADLPALLLEFPDRLLGRLHGLGDQPHRQQQLAPVGEQLADRRALRAQRSLGQVEVVQRGGRIAAQRIDPPQVLVHEPQRQVQLQPRT